MCLRLNIHPEKGWIPTDNLISIPKYLFKNNKYDVKYYLITIYLL